MHVNDGANKPTTHRFKVNILFQQSNIFLMLLISLSQQYPTFFLTASISSFKILFSLLLTILFPSFSSSSSSSTNFKQTLSWQLQNLLNSMENKQAWCRFVYNILLSTLYVEFLFHFIGSLLVSCTKRCCCFLHNRVSGFDN